MKTTLHSSSGYPYKNVFDSTEFLSSSYDKYAPAVYGVLIKWVKSESAAQFILQQAFNLYAKEIFSTGNEGDKPLIRLLQIARKECDLYHNKQNSFLTTKFKEFSSANYAALL
jgi:hypothetical protein